MPKIADTYSKIKLTGYTRGIRGHKGPQGPQGEPGIPGPQGYRGPKGLIGEPGQLPDFSIGTVEKVNEISQAEITTTGTDEHPVLNMKIPKGEKGEQGESPVVSFEKEGNTTTMEVELEGETNTYQFVDGEHQYEAGDGISIENNVVTNTLQDYIYDSGTKTKETPFEADDVFFEYPNVLDVKGNTTQTTTSGKNLLSYAYDYGYSTTINGITWTINNDGTITANGTASSLSIFQFANANNLSSLIGKTIILNGTPSGINQEIYIGIYTATYGAITNAYVGRDSSSVTIDDTATRLLARIPNGATANNIVFKPMIRLATVSDNTYEPYTHGPTPNPYYPQPINVVSGRQDIVVAQENALDIQRIVKGRLDSGNIGYESNVTNLDLGEESFSFTTNANYRGVTTDFIHLRTSTFIYFGYESTTTNIGATVSYYDENMKFISQSGGYGMTNAVRYGNSVANAKYIRIYFALNTAGSVTITKPQIRFSNENSIPTYEAYKGNTYEINLGKNLFDKSIANLNKGVNTSTGGIYNDNSQFATDYIEITPNTSYVVNGFSSSANRVYGAFYNGAKSYLGAVSTSVNVKTFTITNSEARYIRLTGQLSEIDTYQLEKGSQATTYAPYKTPIELCKIGNYQDIIYKDGNKWYLEKQIGKTVITNDNKSIVTSYGTNSNHKKIDINKTSLGWKSNNTTGIALINNYKEVTSFADVDTGCFGCNFNSSVVRIWNDDFTDLTNAQDTLIGTEIYIVQKTPTYIEITDSELISQLEGIKLLEGLNNVSVVSPYLSGIFEIEYYVDNVNGKIGAIEKMAELLERM